MHVAYYYIIPLNLSLGRSYWESSAVHEIQRLPGRKFSERIGQQDWIC